VSTMFVLMKLLQTPGGNRIGPSTTLVATPGTTLMTETLVSRMFPTLHTTPVETSAPPGGTIVVSGQKLVMLIAAIVTRGQSIAVLFVTRLPSQMLLPWAATMSVTKQLSVGAR